MPTEALPAQAVPRHPVAGRRTLRLALGTALCLWFSQAYIWPLSFISPVMTLFILALPMPAPGLKQGIKFVVALIGPLFLGMTLLPFMEHARWAGILLLTLALFYSFYYTSSGGSAILGSFMTVGLTLIVTVGSVSPESVFPLLKGLAAGAVFGLIFAWIAHAILPDLPPEPSPGQSAAAPKKPARAKPDLPEARRSAFRSLLIVLPMALIFLFMSASTNYTVVMIKVASMGQQASSDDSRKMGRSLLQSTIWGGVGAILGWYIMSIWPSLLLYTLLIALAALSYGRGMFRGPGLHPQFSMWMYAFLTMIVILAPALLDGPGSSGAGAAFWTRLGLFMVIALYGTGAVAVFDAFWPKREPAS